MSEVLHFAFSGVNLIPTTLLIFVIAYWFIVIIGVIDVEAFDVDFEMDMDGEVEIGGLASVLSFFNIGEMPFMVFVTFFSLPLWFLTLVFNDLLGLHSWSGLIVFGPAFLSSLFVAKFLTIPIAKFYKKVKQNTEAVEEIIGKICTAKLNIGPDRKGQAEIKVKGTSVLIYAKTRNDETVNKGETALVIEFVKEENYYFVEPYKL